MVEFIALYASCFNFETKNPDRTLDLIDRSMVTAKRKGKKQIDKECVLENFKVNIKALNNMTEEERKALAYHEAGHYIAHRFLPYLYRTTQIIAVSIYPAENYFGVTVHEPRKNVYVTGNYRAHLEKIASKLAGGVAESRICDKNDGVSSDSYEATISARHLIAETGFYDDFFCQIDELDSEKNTNSQIDKVKEILKKSKEIAEKVLQDRERELVAVVNELLKRKILSGIELEAIVSKVQKEHEKDANKGLA